MEMSEEELKKLTQEIEREKLELQEKDLERTYKKVVVCSSCGKRYGLDKKEVKHKGICPLCILRGNGRRLRFGK